MASSAARRWASTSSASATGRLATCPGARQITEELRRHLAIPDGEDTDAARMFTLDEVACLGCCSLAPVLMVDGHTAGKLTPATACDALKVTA